MLLFSAYVLRFVLVLSMSQEGLRHPPPLLGQHQLVFTCAAEIGGEGYTLPGGQCASVDLDLQHST